MGTSPPSVTGSKRDGGMGMMRQRPSRDAAGATPSGGLEALLRVHLGARVSDGLGGILVRLQRQLKGVPEVAPELVELHDLRPRETRGDGIREALGDGVGNG